MKLKVFLFVLLLGCVTAHAQVIKDPDGSSVSWKKWQKEVSNILKAIAIGNGGLPQELEINGKKIYITGGNEVTLPTWGNSDDTLTTPRIIYADTFPFSIKGDSVGFYLNAKFNEFGYDIDMSGITSKLGNVWSLNGLININGIDSFPYRYPALVSINPVNGDQSILFIKPDNVNLSSGDSLRITSKKQMAILSQDSLILAGNGLVLLGSSGDSLIITSKKQMTIISQDKLILSGNDLVLLGTSSGSGFSATDTSLSFLINGSQIITMDSDKGYIPSKHFTKDSPYNYAQMADLTDVIQVPSAYYTVSSNANEVVLVITISDSEIILPEIIDAKFKKITIINKSANDAYIRIADGETGEFWLEGGYRPAFYLEPDTVMNFINDGVNYSFH